MIRRTIGPTIEMETALAIGLWTTICDANQLENAILNLCINAKDAMPDGGRLTIETANKWVDDQIAKERDMRPGQYIQVSVSDTGTGMPPDVVARAFDPFFTTKPTGEGTGLGLSMIYGFVRQSNGQVRIYTEIGKGTTVALYLPRHWLSGRADEDERWQMILCLGDLAARFWSWMTSHSFECSFAKCWPILAIAQSKPPMARPA